MSDIRWNSPFQHSFAYSLFEQHFTELNKLYWANVPASSTIEKKAMQFNISGKYKPIDFFLISDENEHRIAPNFDEWKNNYREFLNFTRLNMLLSLTSCFEIYMRSIISLAFESSPGIIWGKKEILDGAKMLKNGKTYYTYNENTYPFYKYVDSICKGTWTSRLEKYKHFFITAPSDIFINSEKLDSLRKLRNDIAHYYGRQKNKYETPILLKSEPATRVTHERLIKFFDIIHMTAKTMDIHLYKEYIGSYEVLKYYIIHQPSQVQHHPADMKAKWLQKELGHAGAHTVGTNYYKDLLIYFESL